MTVDANIALAVIDESDAFHEPAIARVAEIGDAPIRTVPLAEAL